MLKEMLSKIWDKYPTQCATIFLLLLLSALWLLIKNNKYLQFTGSEQDRKNFIAVLMLFNGVIICKVIYLIATSNFHPDDFFYILPLAIFSAVIKGIWKKNK